MKNKNIISEENQNKKFAWKISECLLNDCDFKCCSFDHWNYIVMYPWELAQELEKNLNSNHLEIIEHDYIMPWGMKVICNSPCTSKDVKPLDCKIYPIRWNWEEFIVGSKCPLWKYAIEKHAIIVKKYLGNLFLNSPELKLFFEQVKMVGYEKLMIPQFNKEISDLPIWSDL